MSTSPPFPSSYPFPLGPFLPVPSFLPLKSSKLASLNPAGGLWSAVSSPSGVRGGAPAEIELGAFRFKSGNSCNNFPEIVSAREIATK